MIAFMSVAGHGRLLSMGTCRIHLHTRRESGSHLALESSALPSHLYVLKYTYEVDR